MTQPNQPINQSTTPFDPTEHPHRRRNLLTGEWVLVSPHRTKRPWQGQVEKSPPDNRPAHDPTCYLCPGNSRAGGAAQNEKYAHTFVFENDFAALLPDGPTGDVSSSPFFQAQAETGTSRVICFSPRHDLTLPQMDPADIRRVVDVWADQMVELGGRPGINYVQIFENKGAVMGCSNPHPHGQIWANRRVPTEPAKEEITQRAYFQDHGAPLLLDYLAAELADGARIVVENADWVALVPFWAVWPFEIMLLPRRAVQALPDLTDAERDTLASILKRLTTRYDNLFETSFPYSMGWHGQPTDGGSYPHWQLHAHFYPPLLRSATVKKFMVGYEMLAGPQRDITAEQAADRLRAVSEVHYRE
ncbi:MAG: UDP-glucose--hexose-1-phosphate uridylyltransferase [Caldilineaceae bacterium]|nr:UDP-glucose--hexose-1-phosphate uridylyltransferase [Caldilineaceae bacterium]MBP8110359.1 UDP-glucose--hexose-1-phosphate uridylyltransferase [Caldilineaceae bacterium]MBP8124779.1 UDP-glucose--hexose-1-phosphate uridylyltransferase [Caldilineaceae bacterium]MBP9074228.1 UDP-glucose--hexose-1-phosphate uridylyltransferase [Caldilineaceae bacterium]